MTPPIVLFDDPRLTTRTADIVLTNQDDAAAVRMVSQYAEMLPEAPVVSAPMFGLSKRMLFLRHSGRPFPLFNPVLTEARDFSFKQEELWFGMSNFRVRARRPEFVSVEAVGVDGTGKNVQVSGNAARWMHWHLELLNGVAPIYKLTPAQRFQAYRLQYFQEQGWPLKLNMRMLDLVERTEENPDSHIVFEGEYDFIVPAMTQMPGQPQSYKVNLRDPFACLSAAERTILHIFFARHLDAPFSLFQVANPMLVLAANLLKPAEGIIAVADDPAMHVIHAFSDDVAGHKVSFLKNKLSDANYRDKANILFLDWYWPEDESDKIEADIRKISKKLSAQGIVYMVIPSKLEKLALAKTIFSKVFPRVASRAVHGADILAGMRSTDAPAGEIKLPENLLPFPWQGI